MDAGGFDVIASEANTIENLVLRYSVGFLLRSCRGILNMWKEEVEPSGVEHRKWSYDTMKILSQQISPGLGSCRLWIALALLVGALIGTVFSSITRTKMKAETDQQ